MSEELKIIDKNKKLNQNFILEVNRLVNQHGLDYMDAVLHYCDKNNIEIEAVAPIIKANPKIKSGLRQSAENLNFMPKESRLPI